jgi:hypothetical protein
VIGGGHPRPVEALRSAQTPGEQLEWEGVYDRRWERHRDQALTVGGLLLTGFALAAGHWFLLPVGVAGAAGTTVRSWWQARSR